MVSLHPVNISYLEETESCFPKTCEIRYKSYTKGSIMDVIMKHSPIFSFLAQYSKLDDLLDSMEFNGTCIAPCKEYSDKYFSWISKNIDHLKAREIVLSSLLRSQMLYSNLENEESIPTLNPTGYYIELENLNNMLFLRNTKNPGDFFIFTKTDLKCKNGVLHLINGLIDPQFLN
jgi:hypothetical protein